MHGDDTEGPWEAPPRPRLLLVDDDAGMRRSAMRFLARAGFDVLGMALTLHAEIGPGEPPDGAQVAGETHPATVAFRRLGGDDVVLALKRKS